MFAQLLTSVQLLLATLAVAGTPDLTIFGGATTLHFERGRQPCLMLPVIPAKREAPAKSKARKGRRTIRSEE